jgi:hypothetical protein
MGEGNRADLIARDRALIARMREVRGHIEDMGEQERVYMLGALTGALERHLRTLPPPVPPAGTGASPGGPVLFRCPAPGCGTVLADPTGIVLWCPHCQAAVPASAFLSPGGGQGRPPGGGTAAAE